MIRDAVQVLSFLIPCARASALGTLNGSGSLYGDDDDFDATGPLYDSDPEHDGAAGVGAASASDADLLSDEDDEPRSPSFPKAKLLDAPLELVRVRLALRVCHNWAKSFRLHICVEHSCC